MLVFAVYLEFGFVSSIVSFCFAFGLTRGDLLIYVVFWVG